MIAAQLDLSRPDRLLVAHAGVIHDIGKLGIKPEILAKAGPLTPEERTEVQRHSAIGAEVLMDISPGLALMAAGVRAHHERWDTAQDTQTGSLASRSRCSDGCSPWWMFMTH
ncbi:MAG: HD domain-containing protein [Acidimicrobiaceae bacterium]|nr:HD domain-containing protein [Acidimicrobiaceae bacterium]